VVVGHRYWLWVILGGCRTDLGALTPFLVISLASLRLTGCLARPPKWPFFGIFGVKTAVWTP
jgi:hypothetical protein